MHYKLFLDPTQVTFENRMALMQILGRFWVTDHKEKNSNITDHKENNVRLTHSKENKW